MPPKPANKPKRLSFGPNSIAPVSGTTGASNGGNTTSTSTAAKTTQIAAASAKTEIPTSDSITSNHHRVATAPVISVAPAANLVTGPASTSTSAVPRVRASGRTRVPGQLYINIADPTEDENVDDAKNEIGNLLSGMVSDSSSSSESESDSEDVSSTIDNSVDRESKEISKMLSGMVTESEEDSEEVAARVAKKAAAAKAKKRARRMSKGEPVSEDSSEEEKPAKKSGMSFRHIDFTKLAAEADSDSGDDDGLLAEYWGDEVGNNTAANKRGSSQRPGQGPTFSGLKKKLATSAAALKAKITSSK